MLPICQALPGLGATCWGRTRYKRKRVPGCFTACSPATSRYRLLEGDNDCTIWPRFVLASLFPDTSFTRTGLAVSSIARVEAASTVSLGLSMLWAGLETNMPEHTNNKANVKPAKRGP